MATRRPRPRHVIAAALAALAAPLAAQADGWIPVEGEALRALLLENTLIYGLDEQIFFENGRTRYTLLKHRWGWWELRDGRHCTLWPPREDWECFTAERAADGNRIRFTGPDGIVTEGVAESRVME